MDHLVRQDSCKTFFSIFFMLQFVYSDYILYFMKPKKKKHTIDKSRSRYGEYVTLRFHKPTKLYQLSWKHKTPYLIANFTETDGEYALKLWETLEKLLSENNDLKKLQEINSSYAIEVIDRKIEEIKPYNSELCCRVLNDLKLEIQGKDLLV